MDHARYPEEQAEEDVQDRLTPLSHGQEGDGRQEEAE